MSDFSGEIYTLASEIADALADLGDVSDPGRSHGMVRQEGDYRGGRVEVRIEWWPTEDPTP